MDEKEIELVQKCVRRIAHHELSASAALALNNVAKMHRWHARAERLILWLMKRNYLEGIEHGYTDGAEAEKKLMETYLETAWLKGYEACHKDIEEENRRINSTLN